MDPGYIAPWRLPAEFTSGEWIMARVRASAATHRAGGWFWYVWRGTDLVANGYTPTKEAAIEAATVAYVAAQLTN